MSQYSSLEPQERLLLATKAKLACMMRLCWHSSQTSVTGPPEPTFQASEAIWVASDRLRISLGTQLPTYSFVSTLPLRFRLCPTLWMSQRFGSAIVNCGGVSSTGRDLIRRCTLRFALSHSECSTHCRLKYLAHLIRSVTATPLKVTDVIRFLRVRERFKCYSLLTYIGSNVVELQMPQSHFPLMLLTNRLNCTVNSLILGSVGWNHRDHHARLLIPLPLLENWDVFQVFEQQVFSERLQLR